MTHLRRHNVTKETSQKQQRELKMQLNKEETKLNVTRLNRNKAMNDYRIQERKVEKLRKALLESIEGIK